MKNGMASRAQRAVEGNPSSFSLFGNIASRMLGLRERRITLLDRRRSSPPSSISISTPSSRSITNHHLLPRARQLRNAFELPLELRRASGPDKKNAALRRECRAGSPQAWGGGSGSAGFTAIDAENLIGGAPAHYSGEQNKKPAEACRKHGAGWRHRPVYKCNTDHCSDHSIHSTDVFLHSSLLKLLK